MADIDQIIAGGAGAGTTADFSGIPKLLDYYWKGKEENAKSGLRDAFKDGIPVTSDGQPDFAAMGKVLFQKGGFEQGVAASNLDLQRQKLKFGMDSAERDFPSGVAQPPPIGPPSANRGASVAVAPPLNKGGTSAAAPQPAPSQQPTVMTILAQHVPNDQLGAASESISRQLGVSPTDPIDLNDPRINNVLRPAVAQLKRMGIGQVAPNPNAPPQTIPQQPAPPPAAVASDATFGGLVPSGRTPQQQLELLSRKVASGLLAPEVAKVYEARIKALQDAMQPTQDQKNAAASGQSLTDYQNRTDENKLQHDIVTKSLLPKVDKSQESATAARDDIDAIHRSREQLDQNGGVFSGAFADKKLALAKVANALGITDADKITNTEGYGAAIGQRVAVMVKAFGSGTAISDGDRKFAANMAGGQITLNETSMRRILDIGERAARGKIDSHNKLVDEVVGANEGLKGAKKSYVVNAPGQYKKPEAAAAPTIKEGDTAFNPKTKERIKYQGGKWAPFA